MHDEPVPDIAADLRAYARVVPATLRSHAERLAVLADEMQARLLRAEEELRVLRSVSRE